MNVYFLRFHSSMYCGTKCTMLREPWSKVLNSCIKSGNFAFEALDKCPSMKYIEFMTTN
jgi:hypothetical protein